LRLTTNRRVVAMSNNYWDEEDDDLDAESQSFGTRIKELTEQLEGLSKVQRERLVKEVLEKKGVNQKAARLVLKDLDDVNEESVSNWLDDNADLFGIKVAEQEAPVSQQDLARLRQQDVLTQGALTPDRGLDVEQRMKQATSAEELLSILQSQQQ